MDILFKEEYLKKLKYSDGEWFVKIDELDNSVEVYIQGDYKEADEYYIELADKILKSYEKHKATALDRLKNWLPYKESYSCDTIDFGDYEYGPGRSFVGFKMNFKRNCKDYNDIYTNYTIKFKEDGWPIGLEMWFD
ncbi:MAG: hypothetical protein AB2417_05940 [Clostridiaceae bacterium]